MFEVWTNEACTERPVIGNTYTELYLQVNAELHEQCPTPAYANDYHGVQYLTCPAELEGRDYIDLFVFADYHYPVDKPYTPGMDITLETGVYRMVANEPYECLETWIVSSGPTIQT